MHISLINLPKYTFSNPPESLAVLSALCQLENVEHICLDFNRIIYQQIPDQVIDVDAFCMTDSISESCKEILTALIDQQIKELLINCPDTTFAFSLLSTWSRPICELFCERVKLVSNCKTLAGGPGVAVDPLWTDRLQAKGLLDDFIVGEGEISFRKFLQGERTGPGINNYNFEQIDDLDQHCVIPDYRGLDVDQYPGKFLLLTSSRGCVRNCKYCDIQYHWRKYRHRSAKNIAEEIITQYKRHGITSFNFTDSLVNGSMKLFNELCDLLAEYKSTYPEVQFRFHGQFIFRPQGHVKEQHIEKMALAGFKSVVVGLETGSDAVRHDMDKKHTTLDAEWHLEMFKKYGISCDLLMIPSWVTETQQDFQETLDIFPKWQKFVASGTITGIELGAALIVLDHSPLDIESHDYELTLLDNQPYLWHSSKNPDLTIYERFRRRFVLQRQALKYRWPVLRGRHRFDMIRRYLEDAIKIASSPGSKFIPIKKQTPV